MTVRTWFTISALVLLALIAAIVFKLFVPVSPPKILARSGSARIPGVLKVACWPQRSGDPRCTKGPDQTPEPTALRGKGRVRFVVAYPAEPQHVTVTSHVPGRAEAITRRDRSYIAYSKSGLYTVLVNAQYPGNAYVTYYFRFSVT